MIALPYNLLERLRLVVTRQRGEVLGEDFAADITMTVRLPVDFFESFQKPLAGIVSGEIASRSDRNQRDDRACNINNLYCLFTSSSYSHRNSIT